MSSSSLNLYLTKMAQGDLSVASQACRKIANRFVAVPASEREEGERVVVTTITLPSEEGVDVPVFTSEILLKEWCNAKNLDSTHIKLLGADFCAAMSVDMNLLIDPGSGHEVRLHPQLVDEIACTPSDLNPSVEVLGPTGTAEVVDSPEQTRAPAKQRSQNKPGSMFDAPLTKEESFKLPSEAAVSTEQQEGETAQATQESEPYSVSGFALGDEEPSQSEVDVVDEPATTPSGSFDLTPEEVTEDLDPFADFDSGFSLSPSALTAEEAPATEIIETDEEPSSNMSALRSSSKEEETEAEEQESTTPQKASRRAFAPNNDPSATQFVKPIHRKIGSESISERFRFSTKKGQPSKQE